MCRNVRYVTQHKCVNSMVDTRYYSIPFITPPVGRFPTYGIVSLQKVGDGNMSFGIGTLLVVEQSSLENRLNDW